MNQAGKRIVLDLGGNLDLHTPERQCLLLRSAGGCGNKFKCAAAQMQHI
jgi:hypothetical protein